MLAHNLHRPEPAAGDQPCQSFATTGDAIARFHALFHAGGMPLLWQGDDGRYYVSAGSADTAAVS